MDLIAVAAGFPLLIFALALLGRYYANQKDED